MFASMIPTLGWARLFYFAALRGVYIVGFSVGGTQTDGGLAHAEFEQVYS
jgi:hypothetical protein